MDKVVKVVGTFTLIVLWIVVLGLFMGFPIKWMMNYLITPEAMLQVFGVVKLTFWRSFWLGVLSSTLFKSSISKSSK